jgi:hypothetical protein
VCGGEGFEGEAGGLEELCYALSTVRTSNGRRC